MRTLLTELKNGLSRGEDFVFVTIVASSGATPRGAGARMLVGKAGRVCGTIGGGAVEYRSEQLALEALKTKSSTIKEFALHRNEVEDIGMICGGDVTVYFRYIPAHDELMTKICDAALSQFDRHRAAWLICELSDTAGAQIGLWSDDTGLIGSVPAECKSEVRGQTRQFELSGRNYYSERLLASGFVYVCGGGHVAQELVPALSRIDFSCVVLEDRPEFARPELFPDAAGVHLVDFEHIADMDGVTADDYIVVMTRGHRFDQIVQEQALKTPAKYIGVIGSSHKKAAVQQSMREHGFSDEQLARVTTPIGLTIHAETPAEIAVSIAGQLIAFRATGEITN